MSRGLLPLKVLLVYSISVSAKFPEGTVAGIYKRAVAKNEYYDAVRFGAQKLNWNLREFDVCVFPDIAEVLNFFRKRPR